MCVCVRECVFRPLCLIVDILSQLALEIEEKEAILKKMNKQNKNMNKLIRGESSSHCASNKLHF